jgi:hypothetical protein
MDLTSFHALLTDQLAVDRFAQFAFTLPNTLHGYLTDGLGIIYPPCEFRKF